MWIKAERSIVSGTCLHPRYRSVDIYFIFRFGNSQSPWFLKYYLERPLAMIDSLWLISPASVNNNKMDKRNEAMFLDVVPQIEEIIEGSCFINPAICLEAVLDHGARAVIPNKACEYCWVEEKDNQVWEHEREITGQKTTDGVVMHIRSFRNLHMDTIKWSSHPP